MKLKARHCDLLHALWREGRLSRAEVHKRTGMRPTTVGQDAATLVSMGLVRECPPQSEGMGRPSTPLEIDPVRRHVVGISIHPARVELVVMNLLGEPIKPVRVREVSQPGQTVRAASSLLEGQLNKQTLAVGISTTGSFNTQERFLLLEGREQVSVEPLDDLVGNLPLLINNDMAAMAAQWLLHQRPVSGGNAGLIHFGNAGVGIALLIEGNEPRRFINAAHEFGHTRLMVPTDVCYCGHTGCLTQICSSAYLKRLDPASASLSECAALYPNSTPALEQMIQHLCVGFANAPIAMHLDRLVLISELLKHKPFAERMLHVLRQQLPFHLAERMTIEVWDQPAGHRAETGGWVALAGIYVAGWNLALPQPQVMARTPEIPPVSV